VRCALAMVSAAAENPARWSLRVGIHIGPVVAGIVGQSKFSFDLWGDAVNVAARLSGLGLKAAIHLSDEAWARVEGRCECAPLGPIEFKGGRRIVVYRCHEAGG
jgi:adenylate cyclase